MHASSGRIFLGVEESRISENNFPSSCSRGVRPFELCVKCQCPELTLCWLKECSETTAIIHPDCCSLARESYFHGDSIEALAILPQNMQTRKHDVARMSHSVELNELL